MKKQNLAGEWRLRRDDGEELAGHLPGSTYLDYIKNGMEDPFWGCNETAAAKRAHHDYSYKRSFDLTEDFLNAEHVQLVAGGLDTICTIFVNGKTLGKTDNINRTWRLDAKHLLNSGENTIEIAIADPYKYIAEKQEADPMHKMTGNGVPGSTWLRKTACHFGWDWGPKLPPAGLIGEIQLESFDVRIEDFKINQTHTEGHVKLDIWLKPNALEENTETKLVLTDPQGNEKICVMKAEGDGYHGCFEIENPQLWWCNGLGEQPLYMLEAQLNKSGQPVDSQKRQIGLRTITLDTSSLPDGDQFRFIINGVPIFAKGANWIPPDSFVTRTTEEVVNFYIESARNSNMNMLRVWGGGNYESEMFYDACDRGGILVWQDFLFACAAYPFHNDDFVKNVKAEVEDNVCRIRHRASLALWCGNNEVEAFAMLWKKNSKEAKTNLPFYHNTLRAWVNKLDGVTSYWPGSPSGGAIKYKYHNLKKGNIRGDSHLWQIWHGMEPIEAFRKYHTRFCSEFGMESMPSTHTVGLFTDNPSPELFEPVMELHQKSGGGNEKILFYLLAKYRNPAKFDDYVYLTQLVQANTVRFATDCWRRNIGLQNGSLFWQLNDCWPVASWAGIDYGKQHKAVMYHGKQFNKMLCLSNDYFDNRAEIYVTNEYPRSFKGEVNWKLYDFSGEIINSGISAVDVNNVASKCACVLKYKDILKGRNKRDAVLFVTLSENGEVKDEKSWLLVPDKIANLKEPHIQQEISVENGAATVRLHSDTYARYVYLEAKSIEAAWSDNFFDIPAKGSKTVQVQLPKDMDKEKFSSSLKIKSLAEVEPKNSRFGDRLLRIQMLFRKKNFLTWLIFKFF
jgi:Beta-galactosidase/beta-glucuronidase